MVAKQAATPKITKVKLTILIGLLFAFSENVLYVFNIALIGQLKTFFERLLLTITLHVITSLVILLTTLKSKKLLPLGLAFAASLHHLFNLLIQARK